MRLVLSLLLFVLAANSSFAVLLEGFSDYGAVLDTGAHSVLRYAIPFYGRYADTYQVSLNTLTMYIHYIYV